MNIYAVKCKQHYVMSTQTCNSHKKLGVFFLLKLLWLAVM